MACSQTNLIMETKNSDGASHAASQETGDSAAPTASALEVYLRGVLKQY